MSHLETVDLPGLRVERARLSQESARLTWLRRLVLARRDLEVARLMGDGSGLWGSDGIEPLVRDSLDGGACSELLGHLAHSVKVLTLATDGAQRDLDATTDELVRRYRKEPGLCLQANAIVALADAHG